MAINNGTLPDYNGQVNPPDANYPYSSARNDAVPGDLTGTPRVAPEQNDIKGWQQALLTDAGIVPSGDPDTAIASQYLDATKVVANKQSAPVTLASVVASTKIKIGMQFTVSDRGNGVFDAVDESTVAINTFNIVACTGVPAIALVLREDKEVHAINYNTGVADVGAAWNFAAAHANTIGYPLILPAGSYSSSITLQFTGIFFDVIGPGVDVCKITFTANVDGMISLGSRLEGFQLIGPGVGSTKTGLTLQQNQRHILDRVKCTLFNDGCTFSGGNLSSFNNIFMISNNNHGFIADNNTPDNNSITVGMMDLKGNGGDGLHFVNDTPSNVSQQWVGGIISCQSNGGKGFNISGRGHSLSFYDEFNGAVSTLDATCNASQIRMLFGGVTDNGSQNDVISHRQGAAEAISHSNLETLSLQVRDRSFAGQFSLEQTGVRKLVISEDGSGSPGEVELSSVAADYLNLKVVGRVSQRQVNNIDLDTFMSVAGTSYLKLTNSAPTEMFAFTDAVAGQELTIMFADNNTTIQANTTNRLVGGANFVGTTFDVLKLVWNGEDWLEVSRSLNA